MPPLAANACRVRFGMPAINAASDMPTRSAVIQQFRERRVPLS
jgi:hypothetical protein